MNEKPDLIVAIDFGMTCTGVAHVNLTRGTNVHYIQKWPRRAQANENKVPTVLCYPQPDESPPTWGFHAEEQQHIVGRDYCYWFKTYLDPEVLCAAQKADPEHTPSQADIERWTEDYLHQLYLHVETRLSGDLPSSKSWQTAIIEFVFSVPTTWNPQVVSQFKSIAQKAGWGACRSHAIMIGLTEAEAAAVYVASEARSLFAEEDTVLMCDAGGGTTDLSILRITGAGRGVPELEQMLVVKGQTIGSTQIDQAFEDLVLERFTRAGGAHALETLQGRPLDHGEAAWIMSKSSQFQDAKCHFGSSDDTDFSVTIPNISDTYDNLEHNIDSGTLIIRLEELQQLFETQIQSLFGLIDNQVSTFADQYPDGEITHLVLSGGLGNSPYVQRRLREKYSSSIKTGPTKNLNVHVSPEPQLAVCKGVCLDRIGKIEGGRSILSKRCCRASYGTECKILYNPKDELHRMMDVKVDPNDGKKYIRRGVEWFIKKGEPVDVDKPLVKTFSRKLKPGDPRRAWQFNDKVITSQLHKDLLPITYGGTSGAKDLCNLSYEFPAAMEKNFKRKNRHWWQPKEEYIRVDYQVHVVIGPADLTFQLYFDNQKMSVDQPIPVEWINTAELSDETKLQANLVDDEPVLIDTPRKASKTRSKGLRKLMSTADMRVDPVHKQ